MRELQNAVERAIILWQDGPVTFEAIERRAKPTEKNAAVLTRDELKREERQAIINALKQTHGKVAGPRGAPQLLGMSHRR